MKAKIKIAMLLITTIVTIMGCEKEDDQPIINDDSLIIAMSVTGTYVIVSPITGEKETEVVTNINALSALSLGYQSQKAILVGKEPAGSGTNIIYTCDRANGANMFEVTKKEDWDVLFVDVAQTGPQIVFGAQNMNQLSDDNIHKINENGSGYQRLSSPNEIVDCFGISCKIWSAYDPAWSPNGSKIAFDIHLREVAEQHPHNSICIMNADGSNKQVLFDETVEETHYHDICFTQDGQFIVFLQGQANTTKAKVLNISNLSIVDITNDLTIEGKAPTDLWTSPIGNQIIFNKYEPGSGDMYIIDFMIENDIFSIDGSSRMLSEATKGPGFGAPDWQLWNGE